MLGKTERGNQE